MPKVYPYCVNGLCDVAGVKYWRIDNLGKQLTGLAFLRQPAGLILTDTSLADSGYSLAEVVCAALNVAHEAAENVLK